MPLFANVWFEYTDPSFAIPADLFGFACSLSPLTPNQYTQTFYNLQSVTYGTHIIRCAPRDEFCDNWDAGFSNNQTRATVFEIPEGSGHYYIADWCHQVGAGFENWHARIFCHRLLLKSTGQWPFFKGYY